MMNSREIDAMERVMGGTGLEGKGRSCTRAAMHLADKRFDLKGAKQGDRITLRGDLRFQLVVTGGYMEDEGKLLQIAADEMTRAREIFRKAMKDSHELADITIPALTEQINHLRSIRMTVQTEMKMIVEGLTMVEDFFADHKYDEEVKRIEQFLALCQYARKFKEDGTLDAMADLAIHLAIKEPTTNGGK